MHRFLFHQTHEKTDLFLLRKVFSHLSLSSTAKFINLTSALFICMLCHTNLTKITYATSNINSEVILNENTLIFNTPSLKLIKPILKQICWFVDNTETWCPQDLQNKIQGYCRILRNILCHFPGHPGGKFNDSSRTCNSFSRKPMTYNDISHVI